MLLRWLGKLSALTAMSSDDLLSEFGADPSCCLRPSLGHHLAPGPAGGEDPGHAAGQVQVAGGAVAVGQAGGTGKGGKGKGLGKKGKDGPTFLCKGCNKWRPKTLQLPGLNFEKACKRGYDSIARYAKKQNHVEWWTETKGNPRSLAHAIQNYLFHCPDVDVGRGKSRGQWNIALYKEELHSQSIVQRKDRSILMWEEQYYEWAASAEGGLMRRDEAARKWSEWKMPESGVYREMGGPDSTLLMLEVKVGVELNRISQVSRDRVLSLEDRSVRNATSDQVAALRSRVTAAHQEVASFDSQDMEGAMAALANGNPDQPGGPAGLSVQGLGHFDIQSNLIDVIPARQPTEAPADQQQWQQQEIPGTGSGGSGPPGGNGGGGTPGPDDQPQARNAAAKKLAKHYDATRKNTAAATAWSNTIAMVRQEATVSIEASQKMELEYSADHALHQFLSPTLALLKARTNALKLVVAIPEGDNSIEKCRKALTDYIAAFEKAELAAGLSGEGAAKYTDISQAPPIEKYRNMELLADILSEGICRFGQCSSEQELKNVNKTFANKKSACTDLLNTIKAVLGDIAKAVKGRHKLDQANKGKATTQQSSTAASPSKIAKRNTFFEWCGEHGSAMPAYQASIGTMTKHDFATVKYDRPFVVSTTFAQDMAAAATEDEFTKARLAHSAFELSFSKWDKRESHLRAALRVKDEQSRQLIGNRMMTFVAETSQTKVVDVSGAPWLPIAHELNKAMEVSHLGIIQSCETFSSEPCGLAKMMIGVAGTRHVVALSSFEIAQHIKSVDAMAAMPCMERVSRFVSSMSQEHAMSFAADSGVIWQATVGPGDCVYIPPFHHVAELTYNRSDCLGFKRAFLLSDVSTKSGYTWLSGQSKEGDVAIQVAAHMQELLNMKESAADAGAAAVGEVESVAGEHAAGDKPSDVEKPVVEGTADVAAAAIDPEGQPEGRGGGSEEKLDRQEAPQKEALAQEDGAAAAASGAATTESKEVSEVSGSAKAAAVLAAAAADAAVENTAGVKDGPAGSSESKVNMEAAEILNSLKRSSSANLATPVATSPAAKVARKTMPLRRAGSRART